MNVIREKKILKSIISGFILLLTLSLTAHGRTVPETGLEFSTYFGGSTSQFGRRMAVDQNGNTVIVGYSYSLDFPVINPWQAIPPAAEARGFIVKFNAQGQPLFSTWFGGSGGAVISGLALDEEGNILVTGGTSSSDFPLRGSSRVWVEKSDIFITRLSADGGEILNSIILGGNGIDSGNCIALNPQGEICVMAVGNSDGFPFSASAQKTLTPFLIKLSRDFANIRYIPLPISGEDAVSAITLDGSGGMYIAGFTKKFDLPTRNAFQARRRTDRRWEGFLMKLSGRNETVEYATYLSGGFGSRILTVAVDDDGCAWVGGDTPSADFPVVNGIQPTGDDGEWGFITRFSPLGNELLFSSLIDKTGPTSCSNITIARNGSIYATGETMSADLPLNRPFQSKLAGNMGLLDIFLMRLSPDGREHIFSTYLGGESAESAVAAGAGAHDEAYVAGNSFSRDFPAVNAFMPEIINEDGAYLTLSKFIPGNIPLRLSVSAGYDKTWTFRPLYCLLTVTAQPEDIRREHVAEFRFYRKIRGGDYRLFHTAAADKVLREIEQNKKYSVANIIRPADGGRKMAWFVMAIDKNGKAAGQSPTVRYTFFPGATGH